MNRHAKLISWTRMIMLGVWAVGIGQATQAEEPSGGAQPSSSPTPGVVEIKPAVKSGELTLRLANADVRTVAQILADGADMNLIMGDDLKGTVTVQLRDVSHLDALNLVLEAKGFTYVLDKNIIKVKPLLVTRTTPEPLDTLVMTLRYAKPAEMVAALTPMLSPLGKVTADARTNSVVIAEVAAQMPRVRAVAEALDSQTRQVMIQAKLWEVSKKPTEIKGIDWSQTLAAYEVGGSAGQFPLPLTGTPPNLEITGSTVQERTLAATFLPGSIGLASTAVLNMQQLRATIGFLYQDSDSELVGSPHVAVEDGKTADFSVATQVPIPNFQYDSTTATLQLSGFSFKDIGVTLKVTPRINADDYVRMSVKPEVSNINADPALAKFGSVSGNTTVNLPIINTRTSNTEVMIKSGNTLAIGGLIADDISKSFSKVPVLGDVPVLGHAFRHRNLTRTKRNLLVFITPTILKPDGGTGLESQAEDFAARHEEVFADERRGKENAKPKAWGRENARRGNGLNPRR